MKKFILLLSILFLTSCSSITPGKDVAICSTIKTCAAAIQAKVEKNWVPPENMVGTIKPLVEITMDKAGNVKSVQTIRSSGNNNSDESAISAIRKASPFSEISGLPSLLYDKNFALFRAEFFFEVPLQWQPADYAGPLLNPAPRYPVKSRELKEEGVTLLNVLVTKEGIAQDIQVKHSSGFSRLDQAAIDAVSQWKFIPATQGGKPKDARYDIPLHFRLN